MPAFVLDNPHRDLSDDLLAAVDVGVGRHEGDFIVARFGVGVGVAAQRSLGHRLDADAEVGTVVDLVHPVDGSADGPAFAGDRGLELAAEEDARGVDVGQRVRRVPFERGRLHELPMYVGEIVERGDRLSGYAVELRRLDVPLRAAVLYRGVVGFDYPVETEIERGFRVGEVFGDIHVARQQSGYPGVGRHHETVGDVDPRGGPHGLFGVFSREVGGIADRDMRGIGVSGRSCGGRRGEGEGHLAVRDPVGILVGVVVALLARVEDDEVGVAAEMEPDGFADLEGFGFERYVEVHVVYVVEVLAASGRQHGECRKQQKIFHCSFHNRLIVRMLPSGVLDQRTVDTQFVGGDRPYLVAAVDVVVGAPGVYVVRGGVTVGNGRREAAGVAHPVVEFAPAHDVVLAEQLEAQFARPLVLEASNR